MTFDLRWLEGSMVRAYPAVIQQDDGYYRAALSLGRPEDYEDEELTNNEILTDSECVYRTFDEAMAAAEEMLDRFVQSYGQGGASEYIH